MKKEGKILIIDDEADILLTLRIFLKQHYTFVKAEPNPHYIPRLLRQFDFDVVLLDMNFRQGDTSGEDGITWLTKVRELSPDTQVIMITAYGDVNTAVKALKAGASDFVLKPWKNEKLLETVNTAYDKKRNPEATQPAAEVSNLSVDIDQQYSQIIGESEPIQRTLNTVGKVSKTDANILVLGANGTGKELIAREIHRQSERADKVFVSVDLGAVPESLFESELFGHKKGSFTDAYEDRIGRFEAANGGTLFLDEIGNLSLPLQAKLLSALQTRTVRKIGEHRPTKINIRLVCATNMPLYEMVKEGTFRQDLLYRINTVELRLPSLAERGEDIPLLAKHFLKIYSKKYQKPSMKFAKETLAKLLNYHWPGNIRELRHAVERAIILAEGNVLQKDDFLFQEAAPSSNGDGIKVDSFNLEEVERQAINKALNKHKGNVSKAADELGITRQSLYRRMEKHGL
ncbi:MAG: sigma-54 dependent transcriptional regulator [Bacteroidota bacterium]